MLASLRVATAAGQEPVTGVWTLWSIDGLSPENSLPSQFMAPAVELDGHQYAAGDIGSETQIVSLRLEVLAGGDFRQVGTTLDTHIFSPDAVQIMTGVRPAQARRIEQESEETSSLGTWRTESDSVFFERDLDTVAAGLARTLLDLIPGQDPDSLRSMLAAVIRESIPDSETLTPYRGVWTDVRLTVVDHNGRTLVFRRQ